MSDVSVVIPTHNRSALLRCALNSVVRQRDVDFEAIVVDDASNEPAARVIAEIGDDRVSVVRFDEPQGVSRARNAAIDRATGKWLAFLDDDDLWAPDKLTSQLAALHRAGSHWSYTGAVNIDVRNEILSGAPPVDPETIVRELRSRNLMPAGCSGVMALRRLVVESGAFDPDLPHMQDWALWIRMTDRSGRPSPVVRPLVGYRIHAATISSGIAGAGDIQRLVETYGVRRTPALHRDLGWAALKGGRRFVAIRQYARAVGAGDISSVGRMLASLYHGRSQQALFRLQARSKNEAWVAQARQWLRDIDPPGE